MSCKICFNNFDHSKHRPYQLSCPHTYCISCLNKLKSNKCPMCNSIIVNKNTNIALLELIQESDYDRLKSKISKNLIEINNSKTELEFKREIKLKEYMLKLKKIKNFLNSETNRSIEQLRHNQYDLNKKINSLKNDLVSHLFQFNIEEIKIGKAKIKIENDQLDEKQLQNLSDDIEKIKNKIAQIIIQIDFFHRDYEFLLQQF